MKSIIIVLGVFIVLFFTIIAVGTMVIVDKNYLIAQIEKKLQGRAEVESVSVGLLSAYTGITAKAIVIGKADKELQKAIDKRKKIKKPLITVKEMRFNLAIGQLITSMGESFELDEVEATEPKLTIDLDNFNQNPASIMLKRKKSDGNEVPLNVVIKNGTIRLVSKKTGYTFLITKYNSRLNTNKSRLSVDSDFHIESERPKISGDMKLQSDAAFNEVLTLKNAVPVTLTFIKKSTWGVWPALVTSSKAKVFKKHGIRLTTLTKKVNLSKDIVFKVMVSQKKISLAETGVIATKNYSLELKKDSVLTFKKLRVKSSGKILLSETATNKFNSDLKIFLTKKSIKHAQKTANTMMHSWLENKKLAIQYTLSKTLVKPKVEIIAPKFESLSKIKRSAASHASTTEPLPQPQPHATTSTRRVSHHQPTTTAAPRETAVETQENQRAEAAAAQQRAARERQRQQELEQIERERRRDEMQF